MIVNCPSCTSRVDLPSLRLDGGLVVCPSCGHDWLEAKAVDITAEAVPAATTPLSSARAPEAEISQLVSASRYAQETFKLQRRRRRMVAAAWLGLGFAAMTPAALALAIPEQVVSTAPATIAFYEMMGRKVNIYGVEIRDVQLQHLLVEGQRVIAIKGELVNVSEATRKIPWLRFGLKAGDNAEVYNWQLDTDARPLRPGETKNFVTRIASPPETAKILEIRFARADEIGSNANP